MQQQEMSVSKPFGITAAYRFVDELLVTNPETLGQVYQPQDLDFKDNVELILRELWFLMTFGVLLMSEIPIENF